MSYRKTKLPTAIDLFCGAGGMSLGFEQAGFDVLAAYDIEAINAHTHDLNFPKTKAIAVDLSKKSGQDILDLAKISRQKIDVIFGGPPCQGFSLGGKRNLNDKRNQLVYDFARLVRQIRPAYFVMENVQGLMQEYAKPVLDSLVRRIKLAGYRIVEPIQVLNAADYGVPQRRKRTIILGYLDGNTPPEYPSPAGCKGVVNGELFNPLVQDALSDLPAIDEHEQFFDEDSFNGDLAKTKNQYALLMRGQIKCPSDQSYPRVIEKNQLTGCLRTRHSKTIINRFSSTLQGSSEPVSRYIRLAWDNVAPTLRAGTGTDHGSHTAPRPIHPPMPRCITTREAARLHSFPDWFQFHGTRWHGFRQIGNSVPPFLAKAVAEKVIEAIEL